MRFSFLSAVMKFALFSCVAFNVGCAVVPLQEKPGLPPRFLFADVHRVPLAYGGGVCPSSTSHTHGYPPTPAAAFTETEKGAKDGHTFVAFFEPHPHHERTCFREGWHLHLRGPQDTKMAFDDEVNAFRAVERSFFSSQP
ncbi:MAG: hypothetical protein GY822_24780 [Deltaproteobacteria bacterium]|nr:hypothetical protein [Deltaproteobacteria bacterium]